MARPGFFRLKLWAACLVLAAAAILSRSLWLPVLGYGLVHDDGPAKADIAVVLAGDYEGHRIEKAAELIREGYVPAALISGPRGFYGGHESDYAIAYAVRQGFPARWFIALPRSALSTREEARVVLAFGARENLPTPAFQK
ncbi:MAG: ElyC/SanA/YdcF family protein [Bryobacteraceae bacterium]